ncbi:MULTISPECIES: GUN4 domain-containing protein [unclassified Nostoc]|uniref:GUN4 domain-containing protein n=1 Tax=unclassified Nostoc TaxID=2593658 RepID=UPI002AD4C4C9|nr:GUN4 domain-containing protein [Nostoc sp. DedQUE03]MDZ7972740.1 GUN4 domain-containing protein [Nostoc sp. DedQUE03]MDZ8046103.1 GUN4 domain-containing protein [Nostoc sp. DedQUE02]
MSSQAQFDVFLAHNSQDKAQVRAIANELKRCGLKPWLDEEQIPPGRPFQDYIQRAIQSVKSAAIFIGPTGLGKWQMMELRSLIGKLVEADIPVIPVLLPGVAGIPDDLDFLKQLHWVNFTNGINDTQALDNLKWGITQEKPITEVQADNLSSEKGVDYTQLRDLLAAGKWKEADEETLAVMLKASSREKEGWFDTESINNFPCTDLRTIDQLWVIYSNGRFGFSVQQKIYLSVGGKADGKYYGEAWDKFGDRVGWRVKQNLFDDSDVNLAPEGHLPLCWRVHWIFEGFEVLGLGFFCRVETCEI